MAHRIIDISEETKPRSEKKQISDEDLEIAILQKVGTVLEEVKKKLLYFLVKNRRTSKNGIFLLIWEGEEGPPLNFTIADKKIISFRDCGLVFAENYGTVGTFETICNVEGENYALLCLI